MIYCEPVAKPWSVFVRNPNRDGSMHQLAHGHGLVVGRRFLRGIVVSFDVQMQDGRIRTFTADYFWNPENIARRMITPSPLRIPAPPAREARACP